MCYAQNMELSASRRNKRLGDAPAGDNGRDGARRWRVWAALRPITLVSSAVYVATLITIMRGDCPACYVPWKGVTSVGLLLLLLLLDRLEYPLFGETPSRWVGVTLLATRLALTLATFSIMNPWENAQGLLMLALIPYMAYLYLGSKGGIAVGVMVWVIGANMLVIAAIPHLTKITTQKGGEISTQYIVTGSLMQTGIASLTLLTILIVFVLVSARVTSLERAHTSRTKRLLAQLETSHMRLGIYSQRAIALTEEHKRTARDIHDGLAQYLAAVSVEIEVALAYRDISPEKAEGAIRSAKEAISKSLQDVRRSVAVLRAKRQSVLAYVQEEESEFTQEVESAAADNNTKAARRRLSWLFPRPFDVVATTLYMGIFVLEFLEEDTAITGTVLALAGLLSGLIVLDRAEFIFFRERPAWWVGGLLLTARIAIAYELFAGLGIWTALLLVVIIPYWVTIYFGSRAGYIAAALLVVGVGFLSLGVPLEQALTGSLDVALGAYLGTMLVLAFVLGIVVATSGTVVKESAARVQAERVLGELRKTHAELGEFSRDAIEAGEVRNSLARDIHDGLGHYLTAMSVQLEKALAFRSIDPVAADQALSESKRLVVVALQEIRSTMGTLDASEMELSPVKSLAELAEYMGHGSLKVQLDIEGDESGYSRQVLMAIYRAAQEGLTNVQKHAGAGQVDVKLAFGEAEAQLEIRDDGKGFAPDSVGEMPEQAAEEAVGQPGYGLQSMKERLELLGGDLRIESRPGGGTELHIRVPKRSTAQVV
jgi:signal transduction histidine kinase